MPYFRHKESPPTPPHPVGVPSVKTPNLDVPSAYIPHIQFGIGFAPQVRIVEHEQSCLYNKLDSRSAKRAHMSIDTRIVPLDATFAMVRRSLPAVTEV